MRRRLFVGTETLPSLDIRNLGVRYATNSGTVEALSNINLAMTEGDFVVAIGASGCGKTTLLSCIAGFLPPTHGTIELDGKPVTGPGADRGVVFQKHALMPWLDVGQNVEFGLRMRGVAAAERRTAAMEQLRVLALGYGIQVGVVASAHRGVDTPADYQRFVEMYRQQKAA